MYELQKQVSRTGLILSLVIQISGCYNYSEHRIDIVTPVAAIGVDKYRNVHVASYLESDESVLNAKVKVRSFLGSATQHAINIEPTLRLGIHNVLEAAFAGVEEVKTTRVETTGDHEYLLVFDLQEFAPVLTYRMGWVSNAAKADVSIVLTVRIYDSQGEEVLRTAVKGEGSAEAESAADDPAPVALNDASTAAVESLLENFVTKVINEDFLDRENRNISGT
jgi:hypothetical protein